MSTMPPPPATPDPYKEVPMESGQPATGPTTPEDRNWGVLGHALALTGLFIPLGNVLAPLLVWLAKRDQLPFAADQSKESLNFQISVSIYGFVASLLIIVGIGFVLVPLIVLAAVILVILAAVKANQGESYRYPLTIRLVK